MRRRSIFLILLAITITISLHIWSLLRYPALFVDEIWQMSRAWGFLETGKTFGMLDSGVADRYPGYWTFLPWLGNVLQATALGLVGEPSIVVLRLLSLLFGGLLLLAVFSLARQLGGIQAAWISVGFTAYSESFWYSAHQARYDIIVAALGMSILALTILDQTYSRWWLRMLCGLMATLVIELHPFGIIYLIPLVAFYLWRYRWRIAHQREAWQILLGGIMGVCFYLFMHIIPYPDSYIALNNLYFGKTHTIPLLSFNPGVIFRAVKEAINTIIQNIGFPFILMAVSLICMIFKRMNQMKIYLVLSASLLIAYILLLHNKFVYYNILITPIFYISIGLLFSWLKKDIFPSTERKTQSFIVVGAIFIFLFTAGKVITQSATNQFAIYEQAQVRINEFVKPSDVLMGSQTYWYGLSDHRYYAWEQLIYYRRYQPGATITDALKDFKPDIIIVDRHMMSAISDTKKSTPFAESLRIPAAELQHFFDTQGVLIETIDNKVYGPITVYRINWDS